MCWVRARTLFDRADNMGEEPWSFIFEFISPVCKYRQRRASKKVDQDRGSSIPLTRQGHGGGFFFIGLIVLKEKNL